MVMWVRRGLRISVGLVIGGCTAVVSLVYAALSGLALLCVFVWPRVRQAVLRAVARGARHLAQVERRRLAYFLDVEIGSSYGGSRALGYLAVRWLLAPLGCLVVFSALIGALYGSLIIWGWPMFHSHNRDEQVYSSVAGMFLLFLAAQSLFGVVALEQRLAWHFLGADPRDELRRRIEELASSRAGVVAAVDDERRRIERDLHDGVQQRLVALGMLLGRARRGQDAARTRALLAQAHEESRQALDELREVAWRVYPTVLDEAGLRAALETVAERVGLPVRLDYGLTAEPATEVRTVAYFVISEAVTNAVKHSGARRVHIAVTRAPAEPAPPAPVPVAAGPPGARDGQPQPAPPRPPARTARGADRAPSFVLRARVTDDGAGGADPTGSGLLGLARRVAAIDGTLRVDSPPGGPTTITAELPCA
ncbi:sensor histidine kinase [Streptomyces buecherae]|uniref:sensor histidine kinase n=2 Tax=Streptomyces buecherae TaxID=2763006 RepID=UPI001E4F4FC7|nr:histidine kinase [Streptomyces buecherae]